MKTILSEIKVLERKIASDGDIVAAAIAGRANHLAREVKLKIEDEIRDIERKYKVHLSSMRFTTKEGIKSGTLALIQLTAKEILGEGDYVDYQAE